MCVVPEIMFQRPDEIAKGPPRDSSGLTDRVGLRADLRGRAHAGIVRHSMTSDLSGRRVLITGAARGIGAATAKRLHARGARVVLAGIEPDVLARTAAECGDALAVVCDVRDRDQVEAAVEAAAEHLRGLDVVVANAGVAAQLPLIGGDPEVFERTIEVNLIGRLLHAARGRTAHRPQAGLCARDRVAGGGGAPAAARRLLARRRPASRRSRTRSGSSSRRAGRGSAWRTSPSSTRTWFARASARRRASASPRSAGPGDG